MVVCKRLIVCATQNRQEVTAALGPNRWQRVVLNDTGRGNIRVDWTGIKTQRFCVRQYAYRGPGKEICRGCNNINAITGITRRTGRVSATANIKPIGGISTNGLILLSGKQTVFGESHARNLIHQLQGNARYQRPSYAVVNPAS